MTNQPSREDGQKRDALGLLEGSEHEQPSVNSEAVVDEPAVRKGWDDRVVDFVGPRWRQNKMRVLLFVLLILFLVVYFWNSVVYTVKSGETGVLWRLWGGTDLSKTYTEGVQFKFPFDKAYVYETRVQEIDTRFDALSKNGLRIGIHASVRFRPKREILPLLHQQIGPDYINRVIVPEVQSAIRRVIGTYNPEDIYGSQGGIINNVVLIAVSEIGERYIQVDDLLIREIRLPDIVATSIEVKLREEQRFLEYEYRIARERQEAKRKRIEGTGIAAFQREITQGINENFLRFKGIEATLKLAESENAKVVLVGGRDGLPMILNLPDATTKPVLDTKPQTLSIIKTEASEMNGLITDSSSVQPVK